MASGIPLSLVFDCCVKTEVSSAIQLGPSPHGFRRLVVLQHSHSRQSSQITWPRLTAESIWPPEMGAKRSAWTATQSCCIGRFNGSVLTNKKCLRQQVTDDLLCWPRILRPRWRSLMLAVLDNQLPGDKLRKEMTARSHGLQSPRRGHAI